MAEAIVFPLGLVDLGLGTALGASEDTSSLEGILGLWRAQLSLLRRRGGWDGCPQCLITWGRSQSCRLVVGHWGTWSLVWRLLILRCPVGSQESCPSFHGLQDPGLGHGVGWHS